MGKDRLFSGGSYTCGLRAAGVLVKDNRILVQRDKGGSEYALPGGHIKIGETLEDGLIREIAEETGLAVKCTRLLWSEESFWEWNGRQAHTVAFYYLIEPCGDIPGDGFVPQKDNSGVVIGWLPVAELKNTTVYPEFLKEEIYRLDGPIKHFISRG